MEKFYETLATKASALHGRIPSWDQADRLLAELLGVLFPHLCSKPFESADQLRATLDSWKQRFTQLVSTTMSPSDAAHAVNRFHSQLPQIYQMLLLDAQAHFDGDPAARSIDEVVLCYPGFFAVAVHRIAHALTHEAVPLIPRLFSEIAHRHVGVDIHPGAVIGERFCIDHASAVVIGETTVIGNQVKIYQGVTLGGLSVAKAMAGSKRHPTLEDRVVVYSNATILGGDTVIGADSIIGGNVWLTQSVPPGSKVYHRPDTIIK